MKNVIVSASFDGLRSWHMRFLQEAAKLGNVYVALWSDAVVGLETGKAPVFSEAERLYFVQAIRHVKEVMVFDGKYEADVMPDIGVNADVWVADEKSDTLAKRKFCDSNGLAYRVLTEKDLAGFPDPQGTGIDVTTGRQKVVVSGCYDWFHTGHVRFFEEVSELGDLYVVVGHDDNIKLLKGEGHPLFNQDERRYVAGSIRYVKQCLVSTGIGWMDAEPEIKRIKPDMYAVNEDGDKPEKQDFCTKNGIKYVVLKRLPKEGLARRSSTDLRGF